MNKTPSISRFANLVPWHKSVSEQVLVLNALETSFQALDELKALVQSLRDEINELKGEDGKPKTKVITGLEKIAQKVPLSDSKLTQLNKTITYFTNHQHNMDYKKFIEKDYSVSSALVESVLNFNQNVLFGRRFSNWKKMDNFNKNKRFILLLPHLI